MAAPPSLSEQDPRKRYLANLFKFFLSITAAAVISLLKLDYIESYLYDLRVSAKAMVGLSKIDQPQIALIYVTPKTIERFQGYPKYLDHKNFLDQLYNYEPQFTIYEFRLEDNKLYEFEGNDHDKVAFAFSAKQFKNFYIASDDLEMKGEEGTLKMKPPLESLKLGSAPKNPDKTLFAKDGVYRRMMISFQDKALLHPQIAAYYNPEIENIENIKGTFDVLGTLQNYIQYHPVGSFPTYSFEDIVDQKVPKDALKNKIVIVGANAGRSSKDYALTPYSREVMAMTNVELQANMFQTLIDNNSPKRAPKWLDILTTILISILTVYVALSLKPSRGLFILIMTMAGLMLFGTLAYIFFNLWIEIAHALLAIFLCYYFFIPYRLIKENRRSWEYYQKNKLLSQVEELKTNFISMMSHDLKTPIARIQGMTELIMKDQQPLSSSQREALDTIKSSSDDLLKFINSILQYGRIESQGIELHKQSKDINNLIADVIKKHEFLARVKKIKIQSDLEPMFPVKVDPELIKQVFSNLLENAIKYSPEDSTVWVTSKDLGDKLLVSFRDEGIGIPAVDLPNIFMKFFRTHSVKTSTIKGSGLGLYLAQYFINLHKGQITVESEINKGSCFTVELSVDS